MKKGLLNSLVLIIGLSFVCAVPALACEPPSVDCSPGFYKNHTEVWFDVCCSTGTDTDGECDMLLDALKDKGPGSGNIRAWAADRLNQCFEDKGYSPCEDD